MLHVKVNSRFLLKPVQSNKNSINYNIKNPSQKHARDSKEALLVSSLHIRPFIECLQYQKQRLIFIRIRHYSIKFFAFLLQKKQPLNNSPRVSYNYLKSMIFVPKKLGLIKITRNMSQLLEIQELSKKNVMKMFKNLINKKRKIL